MYIRMYVHTYPARCRFKLNWKKLHKFHTDLDSNQPADMLDVKLTCEWHHSLCHSAMNSVVEAHCYNVDKSRGFLSA